MDLIRGLERCAIVATVVLVAACGGSAASSGASQAPRPSPITAQATNHALPTPSATTYQTGSVQSLPPGVTVVDTANSIGHLDWSPNGKLLAVLTWGGTLGTGRADVLDVAGRKIASFDAFDMAWVDDSHLMTLVVSPDDIAHGTVTIHAINGPENNVVPGTFGGMLGNGHGSVALLAPVVASDAPEVESFQIWSNGQIGPRIAGFGRPVRWSIDGRLLALVGEAATNGGNGVGESIAGTLVVLKLPEKVTVLTRPLEDTRLDVYFSPDGSKLATSDGLILNVPAGGSTQVTGRATGWVSAGLVVVGEDQRVSLWTPAGTTVVPNAFDWAAFGPNAGDVAAGSTASESLSFPAAAVVRRAGSAVSIPLNVGLSAATWSSGGVCFIATGTIDAQRTDNRLLRVELPSN
jgi:hypothetical protein